MQEHVEQQKPRLERSQPRFRIIRLEERIAPTCKINPQGNQVGNCGQGGFPGGGHGGR